MSTTSVSCPSSKANAPHVAASSASAPRIYLKETKYELLKLMNNRSFSSSTIGFPVIFYVLFGLANRNAHVGSLNVAKYMLASYSCFGLIGAALIGVGVGFASERALGWLELKRTSPMPIGAYFFAKCCGAVIFGLTVVAILAAIGVAFAGVSLSGVEFLKMLGLAVAGSISFATMGLLLALVVPANAAPGVVNLIYLPMSLLSGLWMPLRGLPHWLQQVAPWLPSYHLLQLMLGVFGYKDTMAQVEHWSVLAGFTLLMLCISWSLFRFREQQA